MIYNGLKEAMTEVEHLFTKKKKNLFPQFLNFQNKNEKEIIEQEELLKKIDTLYCVLAKSFGENTESISMNSIFEIFAKLAFGLRKSKLEKERNYEETTEQSQLRIGLLDSIMSKLQK